MLVFLKTSEEAACVNPLCKYTFTDQIPTITTIEKEWDLQTMKWIIKVSGTQITGSTDTTTFIVNGKKQTTTAVVPAQAVFTISDVTDMALNNMKVYFDSGVPNGRDILKDQIDLTPKLTSLSANTGSPGGSIIIANV